ncbi:GDSL-type esterase/lipase family protein [Pontibacter kalidii]|uniref:GDSL-type esterase/lipase family protein n=1 Tax=Pontibacter kalidii TaxID=2592049 RepID=UPI00225C36B4|nr:GDSL-type esterase/lipase family protein [Pontibacter kalidii]
MPLGNSITQGDGKYPSYRYELWKMLLDAEVDFEFVGSHDENKYGENPPVKGTVYKGKTYTNRNEGHWGWRVDEILNGKSGEQDKRRLSQWLNTYTPDIVLMHLGTNDMFQNQEVEETIGELREVVLQIRADNPDVVIFMAQLIPADEGVGHVQANENINNLNARIPALAEELTTLRSPVILVDQNTGFDATWNPNSVEGQGDTHDGLHPNFIGERKMAQRWYEAIMNEVIIPLPVELSAFTARSNLRGGVLLEWQTASETDNAYFEVQRSQNGKEFLEIARVAGAGTTVVAQHYTFTDSAAMPGTVYYRLRQVDTDGTSSLSKVVQVHVNERQEQLQVFPTSSRGQNVSVHLQHNHPAEVAEVHVYTKEGKLVHKLENLAGNNGTFSTKILTEQLYGAGIYLVRVTAGNKVYFSKFVLER